MCTLMFVLMWIMYHTENISDQFCELNSNVLPEWPEKTKSSFMEGFQRGLLHTGCVAIGRVVSILGVRTAPSWIRTVPLFFPFRYLTTGLLESVLF